MQSDRELLELAARANWRQELADDEVLFRYSERDEGMLYLHADNQDHNGQDCEFVWNPLTQDHDALRLAVKLHMGVQSNGLDHWESPNRTVVLFESVCPCRLTQPHDGDSYAATRRAIVRAAAELGRNIAQDGGGI